MNNLLDKIIVGDVLEIMEIQFTWSVPIGMRNVISPLKNEAFIKNVDCIIEEDKKWLRSNYRIKLNGELYKIYNLLVGILKHSDDDFMRKINKEKLEKARKKISEF